MEVPQLLDAEFTEAAIKALAASYGRTTAEAAEMVHGDPRLAMRVESSAVSSKYSVSFHQANVIRSMVVYDDDRQ